MRTLKTITEAQVQEMIQLDPDAPEATDQQLREAIPFASVFPDLAIRAKDGIARRPVGRPPGKKRKTLVSLRLERDILEKFRSTGAGWQMRINDAFRKA